MGALVHLAGRTFGKLKVLREDGRNDQGKVMWLCECECGKKKSIYSYSLTHNKTTSCGCVQKEAARATLNNIVNPKRYSKE